MQYKVGGKITAKKPHACGGNEWIIVRTGADVKLQCEKCKRTIFVSIDQANKMAKLYQESSEN